MNLFELEDIKSIKEYFNREREIIIFIWITSMFELYNHKRIIIKKFKNIGDTFDDIVKYFDDEKYFLIDNYKIQKGKKIIHKGRVLLLDKTNIILFLKNRFIAEEWTDEDWGKYIFMPYHDNSNLIFCDEEGNFFILEGN